MKNDWENHKDEFVALVVVVGIALISILAVVI